MRVLVAGGAGYIGSHTVVALCHAGHEVTIVDNLHNAKKSVVQQIQEITGSVTPLHVLDLCDPVTTDRLFAKQNFDAVIHFAGRKSVEEGVSEPLDYYHNNLNCTFSLLAAMRRHEVNKLIFSSSATVYGSNAPIPLQEDYTPLRSGGGPYGWTKVMNERVLADVASATLGLKVALLRYFNPIGAHSSGRIGEDPRGIPSNLLPYIAQVAVGRRSHLTVNGADYLTSDGSCERDYIHVVDLAAGHLAALDRIENMSTPVRAFNLGTGTATSVLTMIRAFEEATGINIPYSVGPRRAGDVAVSYADPSRAESELGWSAAKTVHEMCLDTWRWQSQNPDGYPA